MACVNTEVPSDKVVIVINHKSLCLRHKAWRS